ncbi:little elongation complex subunit 2-like isoform X2 [Portunus trituberculatus]|uniref:little elongation complex subunit 2-like isoform X2 n=1 Tax=Portunus trituberculatus TaxID=210409 RepID=UPI001E1D00DF|nr:little elongation complex subunit 2-like isoform X2 [Portunus trituberculatus]
MNVSVMNRKSVTFIPGIFRAQHVDDNIQKDEPFVSEESLQQYCSLFAVDGVPSNIREDPYLAEIIKFSDEDLDNIAQVQNQRQERQREEEKEIEEKEKAEKKANSKVDQIFKEKAFYLKKQCPVKIPYKSSLTHEEHAAYLQVFLRLKKKSTTSGAEIPGYDNFLRLQNRVFEEQVNFMKFSHQVAVLELQAYNTIPGVINKYIDEYFQHRCKRASKYKEHYTTEQQIPICPLDHEKNFGKLSFTHIGHLLSLGTLPLIMIPHKLGSYTLKIDETVSERECRAQRMVQDRNVLNDTPVSADRNAEYLAQQHRANIVISTSALKVLADNHGPNFDKEWDIPVEVKSYMIKDPDGNQTQHRVVYIDKPMPKKIWTPLEKKQLFFKKASLSHFTKIMRNKMFRMAAPAVFRYSETNINDYDATSRTVAEYDDPFLDLTDATDNDVFGSESLEKRKKETYSKKRKANNKTVNKSPVSAKLSRLETDKLPVPEGKIQEDGNPKVNSQDDTEQETFDESNSKHFLDSLLSLQNSLLKPSHTPAGNETEAQKDKTSKPNRSQPRPWTNKLTTNWMNAFEPHLCPGWTGKNVHYQLFSLGPDAGHSNTPLRILVRSNLHGLSHFKKEPKKCKTYVTSTKIENQPYFGCEVSTLSEITQQWIQLLVRPNTSLLLFRVCNNSGEILMTEERGLSEILKDGKQSHVVFCSSQPLATFYAVFSTVLRQPTGHYLLHHDPNTEAFIHLMKAVDPDKETYLQVYNLHKAYTTVSVSTKKYTAPPWASIDTHILTPFHMKHMKIPATFPMDNPKKKLTKAEKKKVQSRAKSKKSLQDLYTEKEELSAF